MTGMRWATTCIPTRSSSSPSPASASSASRTSADSSRTTPAWSRATTQLEDLIGGTTYALTPSYTVIAVDGSGDRGTAVLRVRYPDGSMWWAVNLYELRDGLIARSRTYFAPDFDPPDWRAPYRDAP